MPAEHLVAAADAEHRPPARGPRGDRVGQAAVAQPRQVGDGRPGPGQHHQVGVGQLGRARSTNRTSDAGLGGQRVDVGGVGDPRAAATTATRSTSRRRTAGARPAERGRSAQGRGESSRVEPQPVRPGQHAEHGPAGQLAEHVEARLRAAPASPRNLLTTKPGDQRLVLGVEQRRPCRTTRRTRRRGRCRRPRRTGRSAARARPMLAMSVGPQVDLGRAARRPRRRPRRTRARRSARRPATTLAAARPCARRYASGARPRPPACPSTTTWLRPVAARLEQHRVHRARSGSTPARLRLHRLGPADLGAVGGDDRVVRHVLRLERRDLHALAGQPAADARR